MTSMETSRVRHPGATALLLFASTLGVMAGLTVMPVLEVIRRDKKVLDGTLHFVLPTGIGSTTIATNVNEAELVDAMLAVGFRR